ncbi:MAG TPA: class I SAM-dependent methyltransferase [Steroidobacteraceae bacterium]|nr:class I SAM-dependent methyltransferase [Steroidobacteraceae bacterium]
MDAPLSSSQPRAPTPATDSRRFQSAAAHYLRGRPEYPRRLVGDVSLLCGLNSSHRLLDLGCGPAPLAVMFAPLVREVVAVDPEPAMLAVAADHAARAAVSVRFVQSRGEDLEPSLGTFRLVTIGRAFHWMDRTRTLARLDALIEPEGAVVLFGDRHPEEYGANGWVKPYRAVLERFAVDDAGRAQRAAPEWQSHENVLLGSPFGTLERVTVIEQRLTPVAMFVERAFSMSSTAPARLGGRAAQLADEVRELMTRFATPAGDVAELIASEALIARRT